MQLMARLMTIGKYAAYVGMSRTALYKNIDSGKLASCIVTKKGKKYIKVEQANAIFEMAPSDGEQKEAKEVVGNRAKNIIDVYKAKNEQLKYQERIGELVEASKVKDSLFKIGRSLRDSLMNIPERLAPELSGTTDIHTIRERIAEEITNVLKGVNVDFLKDNESMIEEQIKNIEDV